MADYQGKICDPCKARNKFSFGATYTIYGKEEESKEAWTIDACLEPDCESFLIANALKVIRKYGRSLRHLIPEAEERSEKPTVRTVLPVIGESDDLWTYLQKVKGQANIDDDLFPMTLGIPANVYRDIKEGRPLKVTHLRNIAASLLLPSGVVIDLNKRGQKPPAIEGEVGKSSKEMTEEEIQESFLSSEEYKEPPIAFDPIKAAEEYLRGDGNLWMLLQDIKEENGWNEDKAPKEFGTSEPSYYKLKHGAIVSGGVLDKISRKIGVPFDLVDGLYRKGLKSTPQFPTTPMHHRTSFDPALVEWKCLEPTEEKDGLGFPKKCGAVVISAKKSDHVKRAHGLPGVHYVKWEPLNIPEGTKEYRCDCGALYWNEQSLLRHHKMNECPDFELTDLSKAPAPRKPSPVKEGNREAGLNQKAILSGEGKSQGVNGRIG